MKGSVGYLALLVELYALDRAKAYARDYARGFAEGFSIGMRRAVLCLGRKRFGDDPDETTRAALERIADPAALEQLIDRVPEVNTWAELLPPPPPRRGGKRKKSP